MTCLAEMNADLVLTPGLQADLDQGRTVAGRQPAPFGSRKLGLTKAFRLLAKDGRRRRDRPDLVAVVVFAKPAFEDTLLFFKNAFDPRNIRLLGELVPIGAKRLGDSFGLCEHHDAARLAVETMDEPHVLAAFHLTFADIVIEPLLGRVRLLCTRMRRQHPRRLVNDNEIVVFVEDREWESLSHFNLAVVSYTVIQVASWTVSVDGGEGGDRTLDPRLMSPLLYRLSYLAMVLKRTGESISKVASKSQWLPADSFTSP